VTRYAPQRNPLEDIPTPGGKDTDYLAPAHYWTLFGFNVFFTLAFIVEAAIKLVALGVRRYARDPLNVFDFTIVAISTAELLLDLLVVAGVAPRSPIPPGFSALRALRILRLCLLFPGTRRTLLAFLRSFGAVRYLLLLLLLAMVIFSLWGMEFFAGYYPKPWFNQYWTSANYPCAFADVERGGFEITWSEEDGYPANNFDTFWGAFLSVFVVISGENWNEIYYDQHTATSTSWEKRGFALAYFIILFIVANLIIFNLFIGIILDAVNGEEDDDIDADAGAAVGAKGSVDDANKPKERMYYYSFGSYKMGDESDTTADGPDEVSEPSVREPAAAARKRPRQSHPAPSSSDRSLFLFSSDNLVRRGAARLVAMPAFESFIFALIIFSSVLLGVDWPGWHEDYWLKRTIAGIDVALTAIFIFEALLKSIAFGFLNLKVRSTPSFPYVSVRSTCPAYLASGWNRLDFAVVLISIVSLATAGVKEVAAFRALRALRPLRLIARSENMKVVIATLGAALPSVSKFLTVFITFILVFAIIFVQMFGGKLGYCLDPLEMYSVTPGVSVIGAQRVSDYEECMALPKYNLTRYDTLGERLTDKEDWAETYRMFTEFPQWTNPNYGNFDHVGWGSLLLLEIAALEGWPDVMYDVMGTDRDERYVSPFWLSTAQANGELGTEEHETQPYMAAFFFVVWVVLGCFMILNMVVGVVLDTFNHMQNESAGLSMMTEAQSDWVKAQKEIIAKRPLKSPRPPSQPWRMPFYRLVSSNAFDVAIMAVICLNTAVMCVDVYNPDPDSTRLARTFADVSFYSNIVFFAIYTAEMLLKWCGLGLRQYFDCWGVFDCVLVVLTAFDIVTTAADSDVLPFPAPMLRVFRLLRVMRIVRLLKRAKRLRTIFLTIKVSLPGMLNIGVLMLLLMYIFAVFSTSFFWAANYTPGNFGQTTCIANASAGEVQCENTWSTQPAATWHGGAPVAHSATLTETLPQLLPCSYYRRTALCANAAACVAAGCDAGDGAPFFFSAEDSNWGDNLNRHANFENVLISMLTLFRCSTGESFNLVMHDLLPPDWGDNMLRCCPSCGPVVGYDEDGSPVAESSCSARMGSGFVGYFVPQFFFWVFYVLMGYIVLNGLFVGIIVDNYTNIGSENKAITVDSIEEFREAWLKFDPQGGLTSPLARGRCGQRPVTRTSRCD